MNKFLAFFFAFGAFLASAVPVVFDKPLLDGKDARFATVLHGAHTVPTVGAGAHLRFLFLVPKLGADFTDGFASGLTPKVHDFFKVAADEHVTGVLAFSDCKTWFGAGLFFVGAAGEGHRFFSGAKGVAAVPLGDVDAFVSFLHDKVTVLAFKGLWGLLPSHFVVHKLHAKFAHLL